MNAFTTNRHRDRAIRSLLALAVLVAAGAMTTAPSFAGGFPRDVAGWPNDTINYYIDPAVQLPDQDAILNGIQKWEARSPFLFVRHPNIPRGVHTLVFEYDPDLPAGCGSGHGYLGTGTQLLRLTPGGCGSGAIAHELGHALGLIHEHQRPDRDYYIMINWHGLPTELRGQFVSYSSKLAMGWGPYDYTSLMHYGNLGTEDAKPLIVVRGCDTYQTTPLPDGTPCTVGPNPSNPRPTDGDVATALRVSHGTKLATFRLENIGSRDCLQPRPSDKFVTAGDPVETALCGGPYLQRWYERKRPAVRDAVLINEAGRVCLSGNSLRTCTSELEFVELESARPGPFVRIRRGNFCLEASPRPGLALWSPCDPDDAPSPYQLWDRVSG